jgi:glycerol-3-phosphate dehydrogenase
VDKLLATVNATMDVDLGREDVVGTYAGLRPLIAPSDGSTVKASREHRVTIGSNGVVRIGGGKYTTYRVMACDVIDAVLGPAAAKARPSQTADRRLVGAAEPDALARIAVELGTIAAVAQVGPLAATQLVARHGTEAPAVVALGAELGLLRALAPGRVFLEAEVASAARLELALSLDDVLARRTRLAQELPDRGAAIAPRVAQILGAELGWGEARQVLEIQAYLASARREYSVPAPGGPELPATIGATTR